MVESCSDYIMEADIIAAHMEILLFEKYYP
jgi:hypothetical protein